MLPRERHDGMGILGAANAFDYLPRPNCVLSPSSRTASGRRSVCTPFVRRCLFFPNDTSSDFLSLRSTDRDDILGESRASFLGSLGRNKEFPDCQEQLVNRFRGKRSLPIDWTHPGITVGNANGDSLFLIFKRGESPLLLRVMFTTNRSRFGCHTIPSFGCFVLAVDSPTLVHPGCRP